MERHAVVGGAADVGWHWSIGCMAQQCENQSWRRLDPPAVHLAHRRSLRASWDVRMSVTRCGWVMLMSVVERGRWSEPGDDETNIWRLLPRCMTVSMSDINTRPSRSPWHLWIGRSFILDRPRSQHNTSFVGEQYIKTGNKKVASWRVSVTEPKGWVDIFWTYHLCRDRWVSDPCREIITFIFFYSSKGWHHLSLSPGAVSSTVHFSNKVGLFWKGFSLNAIRFAVRDPRCTSPLSALGSTGLWWEFGDQSMVRPISMPHYSGLIISGESSDNLITQQLLMELLERGEVVSTAVITQGSGEKRGDALVRGRR